MKKLIIHSVIAAPLLLSVLALTGCNEMNPVAYQKGDSVVSFVIGSSSNQTKSVVSCARTVVCDPIDLSEETGIDGLVLTEEISSLDDVWYGSGIETKGTPIYTENLVELYEQLAVTAYDGTTQKGLKDVIYSYVEDKNNGRVFSHDYSADGEEGRILWPENGLEFFIQAPAAPAGCTSIVHHPGSVGASTITFSYSMPSAASGQSAAQATQDILFTNKHLASASSSDQNILLYHPLVGVKFQNGNEKAETIDGVNYSTTTINSVTIKGIYTSGDCTVTPIYESSGSWNGGNSNGGSLTTKSSGCVSWKNLGNKSTSGVTETFDGTTNEYNDGQDGGVPDSFIPNSRYNLNDAAYSKTFFLIPQLGTTSKPDELNGITIVVEFEYGGNTYTKEIDMTGRNAWKAGELHTYTLSLSEVEVAVDDTVEDGVKSDIEITNTGNVLSYIRAAVIANWMDDYGKIFNSQWSMDPDIALGTGWVRSSNDGFYYYTKMVKAGATISNNIFDSYEAENYHPTSIPAQAHLEMEIVVQAVEAAKLDAVKKSSTNPTGWDATIEYSTTEVDTGK